MTSFKIDGFKFNRANLQGMDADVIQSLNRHLSARERALNTFEPVAFLCEGGPLDGQTIELCADGVQSNSKSYNSNQYAMKTAPMVLGDWVGYYEGAKWIGNQGTPRAATPNSEALQASAKPAKDATLGRGFEALGDLFADMAEDPAARALTAEKRVSVSWTYGHTDDFGNFIEAQHVPGVNTYKTLVSRIKISGRVRTVRERVAIFSPWCGVDDFGNVHAIKCDTGRHSGQAAARIQVSKVRYTIGRTAYTVAATVQAVDALKARILKAKRWFSDKMLKAAGPVRAVQTAADKARDADQAQHINHQAVQDVAQLVAVATAAAAIEQAQTPRQAVPAASAQSTTATATAPRELATVGGDNGHACTYTPTSTASAAPFGQAVSTGGHTPKAIHKPAQPGAYGFDDTPTPRAPGAPGDVYEYGLDSEVHYCTPVQTIGRHQWRIEVYTDTNAWPRPGVYTRRVWRYIDGPAMREQTRRDNYDWKPVKWTATRGTWYSEKAWPTYDSNRGCDYGIPLTLIKVYNTLKADIEAAIADPYASDAPDFAPIPPTNPANPATRPDCGQGTGPGTPSKSNPESSTGQVQPHAPPLQKQSITLQPDNSGPPDIFDMAHPDNITGAELQTLREACGLSRDELAQLVGVQARTVKHWENGRAGVPGDVALIVTNIDNMIEQAAEKARQAIHQAHAAATLDVMFLLRYQTDQHLQTYCPDMATLPASVHGAMIARVRASVRNLKGSQGQPVPVRVVWMQPDIYEPWRTACHLPDSEATRSQWAAQQVPIQAIPHRGDQPPG